jgi:3-deoxy-7-phosphoheptulonate synthase
MRYGPNAMAAWKPDSWKSKAASQQVEYPDASALQAVVEQIRQLPPLVTSWEVEGLKSNLAAAARGDAFLLQGGDCAESFEDCNSDAIAIKLKILLQMSVVLIHGTRKPVVRVGRIAGQYAKPRSSNEESQGEITLPTYRGDLVNRSGFTSEERTPDPVLMLRGYERAALTLNFIRALADGGFADLHHPENWNIRFSEGSRRAAEYAELIASVRDSISFMEAITGSQFSKLRVIDFFTSHEALALDYEMAQTREVPRRPGWYNLSTHLPWIGMRTAEVDGAHVEYCRGIRNPIGIKVGTAMTDEWLGELLDILDPEGEPGRITLIHRLGAAHVEKQLPPLVESVARRGRTVLWCCDPMHGNTETLPSGIKTRRFDNIVSELETSFDIHRELGSRLGGVHFELTGENVTECIGGSTGLGEQDLHRAYRSRVDPRLNYEQALELAMLVAGRLRRSSP